MKSHQRRPFSIKLLFWLVVIVVAINMVRCIQAVLKWDFLTGLLSISPFFFAVSGLFWSVAGMIVGWGLWRRCDWAPKVTFIFFVAYSVYYWLDQLVLMDRGFALENWRFKAGANLLVLLWTLWVITRSKTKVFFGEKNER